MSKFNSEVDLTSASKQVWLVKLPKYIAKRWRRAPSNIPVGKLKIDRRNGRGEYTLSLTEATMNLAEEGEKDIPKEYQLSAVPIKDQTLAVFSHTKPGPSGRGTETVAMEGKLISKLECKPKDADCYMDLKRESIFKAAQPTQKTKMLVKPVTSFIPISDHKINIEYNERKKSEGKRVRNERQFVMDQLFNAFEKHQYYNIRDLIKITNQPVTYLKEILHEICHYKIQNPHKNMWELKPEYRHYKKEEIVIRDSDTTSLQKFEILPTGCRVSLQIL